MRAQAIQTRELLSSPTTGPRLRHAPAAGAPAVAISAVSAKRTWQAAQRFLTLTQLRGALASPTGEVAVSSGLPGVTAEHLTHNQVLTEGLSSTMYPSDAQQQRQNALTFHPQGEVLRHVVLLT